MEQNTSVKELDQTPLKKKKYKKKKPWWKRLLLLSIILSLVWLSGHYAMVYLGHIITQNLSSIASPLDDGKAPSFGLDSTEKSELVNTAIFLSSTAYEPSNTLDVSKEFNKVGYTNVQRLENTPSYLYHNFWMKKGKEMNFLFTSVNATIATKPVSMNGTEKTLIAIAFRGTNPVDMVDDISDLLIATTTDGVHKGFDWNAENFYKQSDKIKLSINGKKLTLDDVFTAAKSPDCPYIIFVTGHSLGGAIADVLVGKTLYNENILPENILACTFGAPKSVSADYSYPHSNIINIINKDDVVPTIGADKQIGHNLIFNPDENFRKSTYGSSYKEGALIDNYSTILGAVASGFASHDIRTAYKSIASSISEKPDLYFY